VTRDGVHEVDDSDDVFDDDGNGDSTSCPFSVPSPIPLSSPPFPFSSLCACLQAYWQYLHYMCYCAPVGYALCLVRVTPVAKALQAMGAGPWWGDRGDAKLFLITYATIGYFFSNKMVRLVLLMGPIASALGGIALGACAEWCVWQAAMFIPAFGGDDEEEEEEEGDGKDSKKGKAKVEEEEEEETPKKGKKRGAKRGLFSQQQKDELRSAIGGMISTFETLYNMMPVRLARYVLRVHARGCSELQTFREDVCCCGW